jgi:predicted ATPase with chaperone activity
MSRKRFPANTAVLDSPAKSQTPPAAPPLAENDFGRIKGQEAAKRAITIALAGRHFLILIGPSGNGKTMLIEAAKAIDPEFKAKEVTVWNRLLNGDPKQRDRHFEPLSRLPADMHVEVPALPFREWAGTRRGTDTTTVRLAVERARAFASGHEDLTLSEGCLLLARQAYDELHLTPRAMDAAVRVARTAANLDQSEAIQEQHLAEAVQYRLFDRRG